MRARDLLTRWLTQRGTGTRTAQGLRAMICGPSARQVASWATLVDLLLASQPLRDWLKDDRVGLLVGARLPGDLPCTLAVGLAEDLRAVRVPSGPLLLHWARRLRIPLTASEIEVLGALSPLAPMGHCDEGHLLLAMQTAVCIPGRARSLFEVCSQTAALHRRLKRFWPHCVSAAHLVVNDVAGAVPPALSGSEDRAHDPQDPVLWSRAVSAQLAVERSSEGAALDGIGITRVRWRGGESSVLSLDRACLQGRLGGPPDSYDWMLHRLGAAAALCLAPRYGRAARSARPADVSLRAEH